MDPVTGMVIAGIGAGLVQSYADYQANQENVSFMEESAKKGVRWRVNDLEKAGLSPVLATGMAPTGPINLGNQAPQVADKVINVMNMMRMKADISRTLAEEGNLKAQAQQTKWNTDIAMASGLPTTASGKVRDLRDGLNFLKSEDFSNTVDSILNKFGEIGRNAEQHFKTPLKGGAEAD